MSRHDGSLRAVSSRPSIALVVQRPWESGELPQPAVPFERTFECFLGLEWVELTAEFAHARFEVRDDLKQPMGLLHGGIYSAVAETIASIATGKEVWRQDLMVAGLSNFANFLRPVTGGWIDARGRLRSRSESEWLWSHDFLNEQGRPCALVDVTIAVRPITP